MEGKDDEAEMMASIAFKRWPQPGALRWSRSAKLVCAIAVTAAYFLVAYCLKVSYVPNVYFETGPKVAGEKILLVRPFSKLLESDFAVAAERYYLFDDLADSTGHETRSTIQLYENDTRIGPAHSKRLDVAKMGRGRFSHWKQNGTTFFFSSSDHSNPQTNGRAYWVVKPDAPDPPAEP